MINIILNECNKMINDKMMMHNPSHNQNHNSNPNTNLNNNYYSKKSTARKKAGIEFTLEDNNNYDSFEESKINIFILNTIT